MIGYCFFQSACKNLILHTWGARATSRLLVPVLWPPETQEAPSKTKGGAIPELFGDKNPLKNGKLIKKGF